MKRTVQIPDTYDKSAYWLQYKYTVFTGKATEEEDVYEFLNGVQTGKYVVDRVLVIPYDHKIKGILKE